MANLKEFLKLKQYFKDVEFEAYFAKPDGSIRTVINEAISPDILPKSGAGIDQKTLAELFTRRDYKKLGHLDKFALDIANPLLPQKKTLDRFETTISKVREGMDLNPKNPENKNYYKDFMKNIIKKHHTGDYVEWEQIKRLARKQGLNALGPIAALLSIPFSADASEVLDPVGSESMDYDKSMEDPMSDEYKKRINRMGAGQGVLAPEPQRNPAHLIVTGKQIGRAHV